MVERSGETGSDIASRYPEVSKALAYYMQAIPQGDRPNVVEEVFTNFDPQSAVLDQDETIKPQDIPAIREIAGYLSTVSDEQLGKIANS